MGKTFMINTASENVSEAKSTCYSCGKNLVRGAEWCFHCLEKFKTILEAKDDVIDIGLAKAIKLGRKHQRD